jgi:hypothetical protein
VSVAALVISILSLVVSTMFAWLSWRLNHKAFHGKAPNVVATIGLSMSTFRTFTPIVGACRMDGRSEAFGLRLRNDGERAVDVTSIICFAAGPGSWGKTMAGAWPDGPALPHQRGTNEATGETPMAEIQHLYNYRRYGEEMPCEVGFRVTLSTGETRDVGPVRLIFPPER